MIIHDLDFYIEMYFEWNTGEKLLDKLKKYENKNITINKLKRLFDKYLVPFEKFTKELETNETSGICDVISLDECYVGFSFDILSQNKIKIKGFYKDS